MIKKNQLISIGIFSLFSSGSQAISLFASDLPFQVNSESSVNGCTVDCVYHGPVMTSSIDLDHMSVFSVARLTNNNASLENNWLIRYNLDTASNNTSQTDYDYTGDWDTTTSPYSGYLWLEAPRTLSLSEENIFRVYTDQVSPDPNAYEDYYYYNQSTMLFGMSGTDAMNGGASYFASIDDGYGDAYSFGSLNIIDGLPTCIECGYSASLNLIGLLYDDSGSSTINPDDTRALILEYGDGYDYFETTRSFYVQPVPVPAAVWLFGSGLIGLAGFARREKA